MTELSSSCSPSPDVTQTSKCLGLDGESGEICLVTDIKKRGVLAGRGWQMESKPNQSHQLQPNFKYYEGLNPGVQLGGRDVKGEGEWQRESERTAPLQVDNVRWKDIMSAQQKKHKPSAVLEEYIIQCSF